MRINILTEDPQIARVLTEFGLVRELNEGVKRIYADMQEQNLDLPIYTENEQSVTLILKNKLEQRNVVRIDQVGEKTNQALEKVDQAAEKTPQAAEKTPQAAEKTPQATEKTPQATKKTPQATKKTPQATKKTPRASKKTATLEELILSVIRENPSVTQAQIANKIGFPKDTVKYHVKKMRREQRIKREGSSQKGKWIIV